MKNVLILLLTVFLSVAAYAQKPQEAKLTEKGIVELSADSEPNGYFTFDISSLEFEDISTAAQFFESKAGKYYRFRPLSLESKQAIIYIDGNANPNWTVEDWNSHLNEELSKNPIKRTSK